MIGGEKMPVCQNCGHTWSFKKTLKVTYKFNGNSGENCPNCGKKQYVSKKSKNKTGIIGVIAVILSAILLTFLDQDAGTSLLIAIPIVISLIIVTLFFTELSNEQETLR